MHAYLKSYYQWGENKIMIIVILLYSIVYHLKKKLVLAHFAKALCMINGKLLHVKNITSYFNFSFQVTTLQLIISNFLVPFWPQNNYYVNITPLKICRRRYSLYTLPWWILTYWTCFYACWLQANTKESFILEVNIYSNLLVSLYTEGIFV
jgi:hypothetical protein